MNGEAMDLKAYPLAERRRFRCFLSWRTPGPGCRLLSLVLTARIRELRVGEREREERAESCPFGADALRSAAPHFGRNLADRKIICTFATLNNIKFTIMTTKNPTTWKKVIDLIIVLLTAIGSFIGGQASAQNDFIDIFDKHTKSELNIS